MMDALTDIPAPLLEVEHLRIAFGNHVAVHDVSLSVGRSEVVGLVGESGSGKSLTCRSILRTIPRGSQITAGSVRFDGRDVLAMSHKELRSLRAHDVGMIFQDPFSSLNPTLSIGRQLTETLHLNAGRSQAEAHERAIDLLDQVEIPDPQEKFRAYPYELSGGQRQRVMIALALAASPKLLIADEATTALDVSTQAQVLSLIKRLRKDMDMAVLLISHDFAVVAEMCDRVEVVYSGFVLETGTIKDVYTTPAHPYTRALLDAVPDLHCQPGQRRRGIPGPPLGTVPYTGGCPFEPRCTFARPECRALDMSLRSIGGSHATACPFFAPANLEPAGNGAA